MSSIDWDLVDFVVECGAESTADVNDARALPPQCYTSHSFFEFEKRALFDHEWLCVGRADLIPNPGDYLTITINEDPLLVVHGLDGHIRVMTAVCQHRAHLLAEVPGHTDRLFRCPLHFWSYDTEGRVVNATGMKKARNFDKSDYCLPQLKVEVWEGFIFVNLSDSPTLLDKWFAPLAEKFSHWNLPILRSAKRIDYNVQANWKLIFENYSECYHCPGVHPALSKLSPYDSAENDLIEGPFLGGFMSITKGNSLTTSGKSCALSVGDFGDEDFHRVFYYSIFPNMLLSLHPDYSMVHQLRPLSPDRTLILCDWCFNPEAFEQEDFKPDDAIEFWDMTNKQDWHVCELSQQGIASRAYKPGPYSPRESIPAAWDRYYLRFIN